jgi:hypothetical protein
MRISMVLFDVSNPDGLYRLFQHAVHLVTVDRIEIKTSPENFNFIFHRQADHEIYRTLYAALPTALLYLTLDRYSGPRTHALDPKRVFPSSNSTPKSCHCVRLAVRRGAAKGASCTVAKCYTARNFA